MTQTALKQVSKKQGTGKRYSAILDAAERVFADAGFRGASMRIIAEQAGVAQALIHYHFSNKETLFEAMVARRAHQINDARARMLANLFKPDSKASLENIVEALFRPTIEVGHRLAANGGSYSKILVTVANSADPRDQKLAEKYYDPISHKFIAAFQKVMPDLSHKDAVWAYMFAIGVGMTMMAGTGRSNRLSNGECDDSDIETMLSRIVPYICGGIRSLAAQPGNQESQ